MLDAILGTVILIAVTAALTALVIYLVVVRPLGTMAKGLEISSHDLKVQQKIWLDTIKWVGYKYGPQVEAAIEQHIAEQQPK